MTLRDAYLVWTRRTAPLLVLPLGFTAVVQALASGPLWDAGPEAPLGVRSMFIAAAVAAVAFGRSIRQREVARRPLSEEQLTALSTRLVVLALLPSAVGAVLAMMTRSALDFYLLLAVSLVGLALLYPRYDQWLLWSAPADGGSA